MSLDLARGPDFQRMTKGTPGDEVGRQVNKKVLLQCHQKTLQDMVVCLRQANQTVSQYQKRVKVGTRYLPTSQPLGLVTFGNTYFRGVVNFGEKKTLH